MSTRYSAFPGMEDILPDEIEKWQWLEEKARILFASHGFREIRTPLLEPTELFTRAIGETTDIVHKEMYTFKDRGDRSMTLRPEMTASVARAVMEHGLLKTNPSLALYYTGPMFRAERPQAGRKRQFHQIGAELINVVKAGDPYYADWLIIKALTHFLNYLKVKNAKFRLNDLTLINGVQAGTIRKKLRDYFEANKSRLDPDSLYRLDKNVLRIFDSKIPQTRKVIRGVPWGEIAPFNSEFLEWVEFARSFSEQVTFEVDPTLVRGLDYYTGVVFEVVSDVLGAQDALAGGGRYDRLYEELGGSPTPCTGFSIGMERLLVMLEKNDPPVSVQMRSRKIYFAPLFSDSIAGGLDQVKASMLDLQEWGFQVCALERHSDLGGHLKRASKTGASFAVICGEDELKKNIWTLKNLNTREQFSVGKSSLAAELIRRTQEQKSS